VPGDVEERPRGGQSGIRSLPAAVESGLFHGRILLLLDAIGNAAQNRRTQRVLLVRRKKVRMGKTAVSSPRAVRGGEQNDNVSVIGPGTQILGGLNCEETVRVYGKVEGPVRMSASIVVGKGGRVMGDVEGREVAVAGTVLGNIVVEQRLELRETGRIKGDIRAGRMKMDQGARFEGHLRVGNAAADGAASSGPRQGLVETKRRNEAG